MKNETISTPTRITGTGFYDNGSYAEKYDRTEHYEVSLSFHYGRTYVNYTKILNNQVRVGSSQALIEKITDKDVLKAAIQLQN